MAIITGMGLGEIVCKALGIDKNLTHRIVIDIPCEGAVKVFVEMFGSIEMLEIDWALLKGADIKILHKAG